MNKDLARLQIVLVRAENPMNIGQTARAMKNFGVAKLILVRCAPHKVKPAYATGFKAKGIINRAKCVSSLDKALSKTVFSVGFTTRTGRRRGRARPFDECMEQILGTMVKRPVALVFGNEKNGLSNEEAALCQTLVTIPTDTAYPQLNLSHAVTAVLAILKAKTAKKVPRVSQYQASAAEFEAFLERYSILLTRLDYKNTHKTSLLSDIQEELGRYFKKTGLDERELHLFSGILARTLQRIPG